MMSTKEEIKIFDKCLDQWGINAQLSMLAEECCELATSILQMSRNSRDNDTFASFLEEFTDAKLMMDEIEYYLNKNNEHTKTLYWTRQAKIQKVEKLLEETKN